MIPSLTLLLALVAPRAQADDLSLARAAAPATEEGQDAATAAPPHVDPSIYAVGVHDVLEIKTFEEESLSGEFVVGEDGTIDFPLVGHLAVDGLTTSQVDELLTHRLALSFLVDPQIKVQVASFASKPIRILGAVKKPGVYPLSGPTSVLELIAMAGGMATDGVTEVRVNRRGVEDPLVLRLDQSGGDESAWMLQQGDTVQVLPPKVVYVAGEVVKPGAVPIGEAMTISQAIILAGGAKGTARLRKVWIKRGDQQIKVNLKRVLQGRDTDVVLEPDDQILIAESVL